MADTLPLVQTKLHRLPLPKNLVARPRLTNLLDCRPQRPLTLVSAPAGYGKSTLISSWAENVDCPVAWVSLDEHDSDIVVFISYLLGALQTIYPSVGADTRAMIQSPEMPPLAIISRTLINELSQIQTDLIVVLDDYHRIRSTNVHDFIEELLHHPPQNLHLVLGTRIDPPISLNNLRARSKVTEIRLQDLRFTVGEAAVLLERMIGAPVESTTLIELEAKSEGWVTGLRLAALAMRHRLGRDRILGEISLNNRYVSEYLVSEILSQQRKQMVERMLKIAILDRFCAGLCQAVCDLSAGKGEGDAERFIRWLEGSNLFVIPLDDQGVWFRYHHLFQVFLEQELQRRYSDDEIAALHLRAGDWFAQNDMLEEAVRHALAAEDMDRAAQLVEDQRIDFLFQQQWYRIQGLLRLFPRDFIARRASLLNLEALILCYSYSLDALVPILKQVEDLLASPDQEMSDQLRRELGSELAFMWGFVFYWSADGARCLEKLNLAIEITSKEHPFVQVHALEHQIYANQMIGCYREALELAKRAGERTAKYGTAFMVRIQISLMVVHLLEGNLQKAEQAARLALELAQESRLYASIGWSSQGLGYIYYQWNDLESARHYYAQVLEYRNRTSLQAQAQGSFGLARTLQALGEVAEALVASQSAVEWAEEVGDAGMLAEARAFCARLALLDGRTANTHPWAITLGKYNSPMIFIEVAHLSLAAIWIAQGTQQSLAEAGTLLAGLREFCERTHNVWHLIEVVALEALLFDALGERQKALSSLEEAIQLARQGGYIRVFVDLGAPMHALLAELRQNEIEPVYLDHILRAFPAAQATDSPSARSVGRNDLTNREYEILELLAQRLTNQEIAERLVLSPGTVKQHLYNIYQKLHVKSRHQAVSVAEDLGILPGQ